MHAHPYHYKSIKTLVLNNLSKLYMIHLDSFILRWDTRLTHP